MWKSFIIHYVIANSLPLSHADDYLFNRILKYARNTNNTYKPPSKHEISTNLLNATYKLYCNDEVSKLMIDAAIFGIAIYGDSATINTGPKIKILAASAHNPGCVLDVIDCTTKWVVASQKWEEMVKRMLHTYLIKCCLS
jgi:hypothetical protein